MLIKVIMISLSMKKTVIECPRYIGRMQKIDAGFNY